MELYEVSLYVLPLCKEGHDMQNWTILGMLRSNSCYECPYIHGVTFKPQYSFVSFLGPTSCFIRFNHKTGSNVGNGCRSFSSFLYKLRLFIHCYTIFYLRIFPLLACQFHVLCFQGSNLG